MKGSQRSTVVKDLQDSAGLHLNLRNALYTQNKLQTQTQPKRHSASPLTPVNLIGRPGRPAE